MLGNSIYITNMPGMRCIKNIHFIGIAGTGMCGIAEVLKNQGYTITGSDIIESIVTDRLKKKDIKVYIGHQAKNVRSADVVVFSSAIDSKNPEICEANRLRLPVVPRAQMLSELMRYRYGIAVAGTHGKTTTTSLISSVFAYAKLDPTFIIGGRLNSANSNAQLGRGHYLIAEADESDASFMHLNPMISIITNIGEDHLSTYNGDFNKLKNTFIDFLHNLPFYGLAIVCIDCPIIKDIIPRINRQVITYGFSKDADIFAQNCQHIKMRTNFQLVNNINNKVLDITLNIPGRHNVLNALASYIVSSEEGISDNLIQASLDNFQGVGRRSQIQGEYHVANRYHQLCHVTLIDDYGHHPTEIHATINAVRNGWPEKRIVMVFQPHRYSRTRDLYDDFIDILSQVDVLILLNVYPAGENLIIGADARSLSRSIRQRGKVDPVLVTDHEKIMDVLYGMIQKNDLIITQGAGSVGKLSHQLMKNFSDIDNKIN